MYVVENVSVWFTLVKIQLFLLETRLKERQNVAGQLRQAATVRDALLWETGGTYARSFLSLF